MAPQLSPISREFPPRRRDRITPHQIPFRETEIQGFQRQAPESVPFATSRPLGAEVSWAQPPQQGNFPPPPPHFPLPPAAARAQEPPRANARAPARRGPAFAEGSASIPRHDLEGRTALARRASLEEHIDRATSGGPSIEPQIARLRLLHELRRTNRDISYDYISDEGSDDIDDETEDEQHDDNE